MKDSNGKPENEMHCYTKDEAIQTVNALSYNDKLILFERLSALTQNLEPAPLPAETKKQAP